MIKKRNLINIPAITLVLGSLLFFEGILMLVCVLIAYIYGADNLGPLAISGGATFLVGLVCSRIKKRIDTLDPGKLKLEKRDGYIIVAAIWVVFSIFGSFPFYMGGAIPSYTDAFFETMSGFTTTGATILTDVEVMPKDLLIWRSMMQWIGGMGIIVLSLAVLPFLGVGGMQLYIAEVPGPTKDKLSPRIMQTAQLLYGTYLAITLSEVLVFYLCGMNSFDAICHSLTTISTGGFSTKNAGINFWDSRALEYAVCFYMFLSGVSFTATYRLLKGNLGIIRQNEELHTYFYVTIAVTIIVTVVRFISCGLPEGETLSDGFRIGLFETIALTSGTGYVIQDISLWHPFFVAVLLLCMISGACAGSACGGLKIVRIMILAKNSWLEFKRMLHPMAIIPVRLNGKVVKENIVTNILAFVVLYVAICVFSILVFMAHGNDFYESTGMAITCLSNCGPGVGTHTGGVFADQTPFIKWYMTTLMLAGRLEIFTFLFILTPTFWKRN